MLTPRRPIYRIVVQGKRSSTTVTDR